MSLKWFYCAAIDCGPPDGADNAVVSVTSTTYNSSVTFQCFSGYWFYRRVYAITSTCRADGLWTAQDVDACKRQCFNCYYCYIIIQLLYSARKTRYYSRYGVTVSIIEQR